MLQKTELLEVEESAITIDAIQIGSVIVKYTVMVRRRLTQSTQGLYVFTILNAVAHLPSRSDPNSAHWKACFGLSDLINSERKHGLFT